MGRRSGLAETVVVFSDHVVAQAPNTEGLGFKVGWAFGSSRNSRCLQRPRSFTCSNYRGGFGGSRLGGRSGPPETVVVFSDHVVSHAPTAEALGRSRFGGRSGPPETVVVFSDHVVSHAPTAEALGRSGPPETVVVFSDQVDSHAPTAEALGGSRLGGRSGLAETVLVFSDQVVSHAPTTEAFGEEGEREGSRLGVRSGPPETVVVFSDHVVSHAPTAEALGVKVGWAFGSSRNSRCLQRPSSFTCSNCRGFGWSRLLGRSGPPETVAVFSDQVVSHAPTAEALGRSRLGGRSGPPETVVVFSDQVVSHAPTAEALGGPGLVGVRVLQKQSLSSATE